MALKSSQVINSWEISPNPLPPLYPLGLLATIQYPDTNWHDIGGTIVRATYISAISAPLSPHQTTQITHIPLLEEY